MLENLVQLISISLVFAALVLSFYQVRHTLQQAKTMYQGLFQEVATSLNRDHMDQRTTYFLNDPELLEWHLTERGYRSSSYLENKKRLYALVKLDLHESIFLRYSQRMLTEDMWTEWRRVLEVDLAVPAFADVWENGYQFYEKSFQGLVNGIFAKIEQNAAGPENVICETSSA